MKRILFFILIIGVWLGIIVGFSSCTASGPKHEAPQSWEDYVRGDCPSNFPTCHADLAWMENINIKGLKRERTWFIQLYDMRWDIEEDVDKFRAEGHHILVFEEREVGASWTVVINKLYVRVE